MQQASNSKQQASKNKQAETANKKNQQKTANKQEKNKEHTMARKHIFTSESVTEGHPDKIADQIVDAILDDIYTHDPKARVACECLITTGLVHISGEISSDYKVNPADIARQVLKDIGYNSSEVGMDYDTVGVINSLDRQSPDIAQGVNQAEDSKNTLGAGDQGMMFGYACTETETYMPLAISLAHKLAQQLTDVRKNKTLNYLRPDGKTQVSVEYVDGQVKRIDTIVVSTQHNPDVDMDVLKQDIINEVIKAVVPAELLDEDTHILINPTGRFVVGGPKADTGLSGRKIIVDTYGGAVAHGGGAFSGKDPTKVDRSASYAARYLAKNLVAAGVADKLAVQLAYAIGRAEPVSVSVNTYGTEKIDEDSILELISKNFDLSPEGIIKELDLNRPIYRQTAAYGHFGRSDLDLPWEKLDKVDSLKAQIEYI